MLALNKAYLCVSFEKITAFIAPIYNVMVENLKLVKVFYLYEVGHPNLITCFFFFFVLNIIENY